MRRRDEKRSFAGIALWGCLTMVACGEMNEPAAEDSPTIWTVKGVIESVSDEAQDMDLSHLRAALIWSSLDEARRPITFSQEVAIDGQFPNYFEIQMTEIIPQAQLVHNTKDSWVSVAGISDWTDPENMTDYRFAMGALVIYNDLNENDLLDFAADDATSFIDKVVGIAWEYPLYYFESDQSPIFPKRPDIENGINIFYKPSGDVETRKLVSLDEALVVRLEDRIENQFAMCTAFGGGYVHEWWYLWPSEDICYELHDASELAEYIPENAAVDRDVYCLGDGRTVLYEDREFFSDVLENPCNADPDPLWRADIAALHRFVVPEGQPMPEGWPCMEGSFTLTEFDGTLPCESADSNPDAASSADVE